MLLQRHGQPGLPKVDDVAVVPKHARDVFAGRKEKSPDILVRCPIDRR